MLAAAKVNLMLHVTGRREDGYHLLQSLVMFADFGDEVTLAPSPNFSLKVEGEFAAELTGENLITKAAVALGRVSGIPPQGIITLTKNLPIGAGLGGGSADAAAALRLLFPSHLKEQSIAELGSDIPACLLSKPLWMEGVGEKLSPVSMPFDIPILFVNPRRELAAKAVYQHLAPPYDAPIALPARFDSLQELVVFLKTTHNRLEAPAMALEPMVSEVKNAITALDGYLLARMSGSGSTCFGLFATEDACKTAADALQRARADWWIKAAILKGTHGQEK